MRRNLQLFSLVFAALIVSACWELNNPIDPLAESFQGQRVFKPVDLSFDSSELRLVAGTEASISVYATYEDGSQQNVSERVELQVGESTVVSAEPNGTAIILSALEPGATKIDATYSDLSTKSGGGSLEIRVTEVPLRRISVNPGSKSIPVGASVEFTVLGTYQDDRTDDVSAQVQWSVDSDAVDWRRTERGTAVVVGATSLSPGSEAVHVTAELFAGDGTALSATASVFVNEATVQSLAVVPAQAELEELAVGRSVALEIMATYSDGTTFSVGPDSMVEWTISDPSALSITATEAQWILTAREQSDIPVTIAAIYDGVSSTDSDGSLSVAVTGPIVERIEITPPVGDVYHSQTLELAVEAYYSDGSGPTAITDRIAWSASGALSYLSGATFIASGHGEATVAARLHDGGVEVEDELIITVGPAATSIAVDPQRATISIGEAVHPATEVSVTLELSDGTSRTITEGTDITWKSGNDSVLKPIANGFRGVKPGNAALTVEYSGSDAVSGPLSTPVNVVVEPGRLVEVELSPETAHVYQDQTLQFTLVGRYSDERDPVDLTDSAEWGVESDGSTTAEITAGLLSAEGAGELRVTAEIPLNDGNLTDTATVVVHPGVKTVDSLEILPPDEKIVLELDGKLSTRQLYVLVTYSDGSTSTSLDGLTWTSSDTDVAAVANGKLVEVTAVGHGEATIRASIPNGDGGTAEDSVLVCVDPHLEKLRLELDDSSIPLGASTRVRAIAIYAEGDVHRELDRSERVVWSTADESVVRVVERPVGAERAFIVESVAVGNSTVTARLGQVAADAVPITVEKAGIVAAPDGNLDVDGPARLPVGASATYSAVAVFTDSNEPRPVDPAAVRWSVRGADGAATDLASIDASGKLTAEIAVVGAAGTEVTVHARAISVDETPIEAEKTVQIVRALDDLSVEIATVGGSDDVHDKPVLPSGHEITARAVAHYTDGSSEDVTTSNATLWKASQGFPGDLEHLGSGRFRANRVGEAQIVATYTHESAAKQGSATLTVSAAVYESISVTPDGDSIPYEEEAVFDLVAARSDGSFTALDSDQYEIEYDDSVISVHRDHGFFSVLPRTRAGGTTVLSVVLSTEGGTDLTYDIEITIARQADFYVRAGSVAPAPRGTADDPFATIADAVDAASESQPGEVRIHVAAGEYTESVSLHAGYRYFGGYDSSFVHRSAGDSEIHANGGTPVVASGDHVDRSTVFDGFTVLGSADGELGAAIAVLHGAAPVIRNGRFFSAATASGDGENAALYVRDAAPRIEGSFLSAQAPGSEAVGVFLNGGTIGSDYAILVNNVVYVHDAAEITGVAVRGSGAPRLYGNTVAVAPADEVQGFAMKPGASARAELVNNIFAIIGEPPASAESAALHVKNDAQLPTMLSANAFAGFDFILSGPGPALKVVGVDQNGRVSYAKLPESDANVVAPVQFAFEEIPGLVPSTVADLALAASTTPLVTLGGFDLSGRGIYPEVEGLPVDALGDFRTSVNPAGLGWSMGAVERNTGSDARIYSLKAVGGEVTSNATFQTGVTQFRVGILGPTVKAQALIAFPTRALSSDISLDVNLSLYIPSWICDGGGTPFGGKLRVEPTTYLPLDGSDYKEGESTSGVELLVQSGEAPAVVDVSGWFSDTEHNNITEVRLLAPASFDGATGFFLVESGASATPTRRPHLIVSYSE